MTNFAADQQHASTTWHHTQTTHIHNSCGLTEGDQYLRAYIARALGSSQTISCHVTNCYAAPLIATRQAAFQESDSTRKFGIYFCMFVQSAQAVLARSAARAAEAKPPAAAAAAAAAAMQHCTCHIAPG